MRIFEGIEQQELNLYRARFFVKVEKTAGCWLWTAAKTEKGYGVFSVRGKTFKAHRVSFELSGKTIPHGLCLLHSCDNPACVAPHHLRCGTRRDNNLEMKAKNRHVSGGTHCGDSLSGGKYEFGERHHAAKITDEKARQIRQDKMRMSYSVLSRKYGISIGHLHRIVTCEAWKHVK